MNFHIHTYGCQMNVRDSEAVSALLQAQGYVPTDEASADIILVNTCSIREKAEDKAIGKLGLLCASKRGRPGRIVGVMGCMAQRMSDELFRRVRGLDFVVGTRATALVPATIARVLAGERGICELGESAEGDGADDGCERETVRPCAPAARADVVTAHLPSGPTAFVTILLGCENRCAYCIVPDVRGAEYSRPMDDVVREVAEVVGNGARDVTLLGQSVMRYGRSTPVEGDPHAPSPRGFAEPLPRLLERIAEEVPALPRLRFTSGHPLGVTGELVRAMAELAPVCAHLHLPVQSGSDEVLRRMRRGYTRAQYLDAVRRLRAAVPDIAITTDVIVGFPGETEAQFEETRTLLEEADVDNAFVFKYSPRPGTPSSRWEDDVPAAEKERRDQVLLADQDVRGLRLNRAWIGRTVEVLAEGPSLRNAARWSGRSPQNKIVVFEPTRPLAPGDLVRVRVASAQAQTLAGELLP